jgi:TRAP-type transport system periplasmic protein
MGARLTVGVLAMMLAGAAARAAEPRHTLRISTIAPDGTAWAREMRAFAREVEEQAKGDLRIKLYFGGMAGDDEKAAERVERGQLDGVAGAMLCQKVAPSHRALRLVGVFRTRDEADHTANALRSTFEDEAKAHGYAYLGDVSMGPSSVFSRMPLGTLAALKAKPLWIWDTDLVMAAVLKDMGFTLVPLSVEDAAKPTTRAATTASSPSPAPCSPSSGRCRPSTSPTSACRISPPAFSSPAARSTSSRSNTSRSCGRARPRCARGSRCRSASRTTP